MSTAEAPEVKPAPVPTSPAARSHHRPPAAKKVVITPAAAPVEAPAKPEGVVQVRPPARRIVAIRTIKAITMANCGSKSEWKLVPDVKRATGGDVIGLERANEGVFITILGFGPGAKPNTFLLPWGQIEMVSLGAD